MTSEKKNDPVRDLIERTRTERGLLPVVEDDAIIERVARIVAQARKERRDDA